MRKKRTVKVLLLLLSLLLFFSACTKVEGDKPEYPKVAAFIVSVAEDTGKEDAPLPAQQQYVFHLSIRAVDSEGEPVKYTGRLKIEPRFAKITSVALVDMKDGVADNVELTLSRALGEDSILVKSLAKGSIKTESGIFGVSPQLHFPVPTVPIIQGEHTGDASKGFESKYNRRNFTVHPSKGADCPDEQAIIVTAVIEGGFYLTDLGHPEFGSLYLYTHSTPYVDDAEDYHTLEPGTILDGFNGSVFEFFGFTEMSFPTFFPRRDKNNNVVVRPDLIPEPTPVNDFLDNKNDEQMEALESSLIVVKNVTIMNFDETEESYVDYGQFPLLTEGGGIIMASTGSTVPTFNPAKHKGEKIQSIAGVLKQHRSSRPSTWIIVPRHGNDIVKQDN